MKVTFEFRITDPDKPPAGNILVDGKVIGGFNYRWKQHREREWATDEAFKKTCNTYVFSSTIDGGDSEPHDKEGTLSKDAAFIQFKGKVENTLRVFYNRKQPAPIFDRMSTPDVGIIFKLDGRVIWPKGWDEARCRQEIQECRDTLAVSPDSGYVSMDMIDQMEASLADLSSRT